MTATERPYPCPRPRRPRALALALALGFAAYGHAAVAQDDDVDRPVRRVPVAPLPAEPAETGAKRPDHAAAASAPPEAKQPQAESSENAPASETPDETDETNETNETNETSREQADVTTTDGDDYQLGGSTVYGEDGAAQRLSGASNVVGSEVLERFEEDDVHAVLAKVPGVFVREEDGYGLRPNIGIRGSSTNRSKKLTLMEDGVLFAPAPYSAPAAYYFPLTTRMTELEVYKDASVLRFGPNTVAGALNLVTRSIPSESEGRVDLSISRTLFQEGAADDWGRKVHAHYGTSSENYGVLFEGVHMTRDGFKVLDGGGDTGFERNELMFKLRAGDTLAPDVDGMLELKLGFSDELSNETYLGTTDEDFAKNPYRRYAASQLGEMDWTRWQVALTGFVTVGNDFDLTVTAYRNQFERRWRKFDSFVGTGIPTIEAILRDPTGLRRPYYEVLTGERDSSENQIIAIGTNQREYVSQGVQGVMRFRHKSASFSNELEIGLRGHSDQIIRHHTDENYAMERAQLVRTGDPVTADLDNMGKARALSVYAMNQATWGRLGLLPGVRVEYINTQLTDLQTGAAAADEQFAFIPGLGATFALTEGLFALAGVHRGFSPKAPGQAPEIENESSVNYEAGGRFVASDAFVEAVAFVSDYQNLTGECTLAVGCSPDQLGEQFNGGRVLVSGLELSALGTIETEGELRFPFNIAYTYTQSEFLSSFDSSNPEFGEVNAGDELPYVPTHQGSVGFGVGMEDWEVNVAGAYVSRTRETAGSGEIEDHEASDERFLVDVAGYYQATPWLQLYLTVNNITGATYVAAHHPMGARPGAPRSGQLGAKVDF